jgi:hypothetical protein
VSGEKVGTDRGVSEAATNHTIATANSDATTTSGSGSLDMERGR